MGRIILGLTLFVSFIISLVPCYLLLNTANRHLQPEKPFPAYTLSASFGAISLIAAFLSDLEFNAAVFTGMIFVSVVSTGLAVIYVVGYFIKQAIKGL